jgi:hypothetical protein
MEKKIIDSETVRIDITNLMIDDSDNQEDNAYNWGLAHAMLVMDGVDFAAVKQQRDRVRTPVK